MRQFFNVQHKQTENWLTDKAAYCNETAQMSKLQSVKL